MAALESFEERWIVGDITVGEVERSSGGGAVGGRRQRGKVAASANKGLDGVALVEKRVAKPSSQVAGSACHQCHLHHSQRSAEETLKFSLYGRTERRNFFLFKC